MHVCMPLCLETGPLSYVALAILEPTKLHLPPVLDYRCSHYSVIYRKILTFQAQAKLLTQAKRMEECFSILSSTVPNLARTLRGNQRNILLLPQPS